MSGNLGHRHDQQGGAEEKSDVVRDFGARVWELLTVAHYVALRKGISSAFLWNDENVELSLTEGESGLQVWASRRGGAMPEKTAHRSADLEEPNEGHRQNTGRGDEASNRSPNES